ncbi:hypothetical protein M426DRAFT_323846 [Hypoxylon sp. CI-4A]|nr:hypothetical protein M426DRAFT_323846 [Hypoxylon sp. CI-4A]
MRKTISKLKHIASKRLSKSHTQPNQNSQASTTYSSLEKLPPEVRRQILSTLEFQGLKSLVHASPVFHSQYLADRRYVLCASLEISLGSATFDAYSALQSSQPHFSNTRADVIQFLRSYRPDRRVLQPLHEKLNESEAVEMASFYSSILFPISRHYFQWALGKLVVAAGGSPRLKALTAIEEVRLLRSFYRFQLYCNLFGVSTPWKSHKESRVFLDFSSVEILEMFFCVFQPWEVEEICCVYAFAQEIYDHIFNEITWDVNEMNPKFDGQRPPTPDGAFDFGNSWVRQELLGGTVSCGLELLHIVLFKINNHSHLVTTMQQCISWPRGTFIKNQVLGETTQIGRRLETMSIRDIKEQRRDPLPFLGDEETLPPLAWTIMWDNTYSNLYGHYVQDIIRRWGYVMWDKIRIETMGARDLLLQQWKADWGDDDPRDMMVYQDN